MAIGRYQPCGHRKTFFYCPHCHVDELGEEIDTLESSHAELLEALKGLLRTHETEMERSVAVNYALAVIENATERTS